MENEPEETPLESSNIAIQPKILKHSKSSVPLLPKNLKHSKLSVPLLTPRTTPTLLLQKPICKIASVSARNRSAPRKTEAILQIGFFHWGNFQRRRIGAPTEDEAH